MTVTLDLPPAIMQEAQTLADKSKISLADMIRDCFIEKIISSRAERERMSEEIFNFFGGLHGKMPTGWKFDREEANSRFAVS